MLTEAMACGRGVVAADAGAMPRSLRPTPVCWSPPAMRALAAGVRTFYDKDPELLGRQARLRAEREYNWTSTMRGLLELYRRTLVSSSVRTTRYATS